MTTQVQGQALACITPASPTPSLATAARPIAPTRCSVKDAFKADPESRRAIFDFNKHAVAKAMRKAGIASLTLSYHGSGDEGDVVELSFGNEGHTGDNHIKSVVVACVSGKWHQPTRAWCSSVAFQRMDFQDAAEALLDLALVLTIGFSDVFDGQGSEGKLTLLAADASASLTHGWIETTVDETVYRL